MHFFAVALAVSAILTFQMFDIEKVGQGHRVRFALWCSSMVNVARRQNTWRDTVPTTKLTVRSGQGQL